MPDPERLSAPTPPRGVPIYAIESVVLGILEIVWLTIPLRSGYVMPLDKMLFMPLAVAAIFNAVFCSLANDNRTPLGAFASFTVTCLLGYLFVYLESFQIDAYGACYLYPGPLGQILASISLAFMLMHALLALAAIHDRVWQETYWIEGSIILLNLFLALVCFHAKNTAAGLVMSAISATLLASTAWQIASGSLTPAAFYRFMIPHFLAFAGGLVTAFWLGHTRWAYVAIMAVLLFLLVCRPYLPQDELEPTALDNVTTEPAPPPPPANVSSAIVFPTLTHRGQPDPDPQLWTPTQRYASDNLLFGGRMKTLRSQGKKTL